MLEGDLMYTVTAASTDATIAYDYCVVVLTEHVNNTGAYM